MPKGFLPSEDTGQLLVFTEAAQDISFEAMAEQQRQAARIVQADPNVEAVMAFIGPSASGSSQTLNLGRMFIRLKPRKERHPADEIIQELRPKLAAIPGLKVFLQNIPPIRIGGKLTKSEYQFTLQDADTEELYHWAPILEEKIAQLPGFHDVNSDLQITNPQVKVRHRPRQGLGARRYRANRSRTRSTTPSARARFRPSTRRATSTG